MKKTIYFLVALASLNVAVAQRVEVSQAVDSKKNTATITQAGGNFALNEQLGTDGKVTITQTAQEVNNNNLFLNQQGNVNNATLTQSGQANVINLIQDNNTDGLVGGNVATITQSGEGNSLLAQQATGDAPQSPAYGNQLTVSQTADNGLIEVFQIGTKGGNNAFITQESDNSIIRVTENGAFNTARVTQNGGAYNNVYLVLDNSAAVTSLGNDATILQSGTNNIFQVKFTGDNNKINVEQIGDNNVITNAYGAYGIGELKGNNNTVNAFQHGNNLHGWINLEASNSIINVTSIAY